MTTAVVPAACKHTSTFIFLHGVGEIGKVWAPRLKPYLPKHTKLVCPTAPVIPVNVKGESEKPLPAWCRVDQDIIFGRKEHGEHIDDARDVAEKLINSEVKETGMKQSRIVLGGFSLGGSLALYTGLTSKVWNNLAGLVILSCAMPNTSRIAWKEVNHVPVLYCLGDTDNFLPLTGGIIMSELLKAYVPDVSFHAIPNLGHGANEEELQLVGEFLNRTLPEDGETGTAVNA